MLVCWSGFVAAQERPGEITADEDRNEQAIEEITVIGMRDILSLQKQVFQAEDRFYKLYNELNNDDIYDIRCRKRAPTGTRIKQRECLPNFFTIATADFTDAFLEGRFMVPVTSKISVQYPVLEEKMKELVLQNTDLYTRATELYELTEKFKNNLHIYFGKEQD